MVLLLSVIDVVNHDDGVTGRRRLVLRDRSNKRRPARMPRSERTNGAAADIQRRKWNRVDDGSLPLAESGGGTAPPASLATRFESCLSSSLESSGSVSTAETNPAEEISMCVIMDAAAL